MEKYLAMSSDINKDTVSLVMQRDDNSVIVAHLSHSAAGKMLSDLERNVLQLDAAKLTQAWEKVNTKETIEIAKQCIQCGETNFINVDKESYELWNSKQLLIQDAFPDLKPEEREVIKTGIHPECWDAIFGLKGD